MLRSSILLLTLCAVLTSSCAKKNEQGNQNDVKSSILASLNRGDNDSALNQIESALAGSPDDIELLYFKAQAYSSKSGIDVYSLFPVLRIKLFEVAMTEWQSYQRYKTMSESGTTNGISATGREEALGNIELMLKELEKIKPEELTFEVTNNHDVGWNSNNCFRYAEITSQVLRKMEKKGVFYGDDDLVVEYWNLPVGEKCTAEEKARFEADQSQQLQIRQRLFFSAKRKLERRRKEIKDAKVAAAYVQAVYVLFEAVPILKSLPKFRRENLQTVSTALDILQDIRRRQPKTERFGRQSRQQITLIGSYLLASVLKESISLQDVVRPVDIVCQMRPNVVVDHYEIGLLALKHLFEVIQDTEIFEKNRAELEKQVTIEKLRQDLYSLPEQPTDEIRKKMVRFILSLQRDRC